MQRAQQVLVPLDIKIRMQPALHQHTSAAEGYGLVDPLLDLFDRMNVGIRLPRPTIERAEGADYIADVRVIYVAIDDVRDDVGRVVPHADLVCGESDSNEVVRFEKRGAVVGAESLACDGPVENGLNSFTHRTASF